MGLHAIGGNAIDAGFAADIALGVVHANQVQFSGVAPIVIRLASERRVVMIIVPRCAVLGGTAVRTGRPTSHPQIDRSMNARPATPERLT